jgi:hypothetical protein
MLRSGSLLLGDGQVATDFAFAPETRGHKRQT